MLLMIGCALGSAQFFSALFEGLASAVGGMASSSSGSSAFFGLTGILSESSGGMKAKTESEIGLTRSQSEKIWVIWGVLGWFLRWITYLRSNGLGPAAIQSWQPAFVPLRAK